MKEYLQSFRKIALVDGIVLISKAVTAPFCLFSDHQSHIFGHFTVYRDGEMVGEKEVCVPVEKVLYYEK